MGVNFNCGPPLELEPLPLPEPLPLLLDSPPVVFSVVVPGSQATIATTNDDAMTSNNTWRPLMSFMIAPNLFWKKEVTWLIGVIVEESRHVAKTRRAFLSWYHLFVAITGDLFHPSMRRPTQAGHSN
jgi:hypothetical protein